MLLWAILYAIQSLPLYMVLGHFMNSGVFFIIFALYYICRNFIPWLSFPMAILNVIISCIGLYIVFIDFPLWAFILYALYTIYVVYDFIYRILKSLNSKGR